jgi:phage-related protein
MVVVSISPLIVGQCVEVVKNMGANHEHMVVIISSFVNASIDY